MACFNLRIHPLVSEPTCVSVATLSNHLDVAVELKTYLIGNAMAAWARRGLTTPWHTSKMLKLS